MKKLILLIALTFLISISGDSARLITNLDIARWYIDSDIVLICTVNQIDTILVSKHDSLLPNNEILSYDVIRERCHITIDSMIKKEKPLICSLDTIITPNFSINKIITRENKGKIYTLDSNGDTTFHQMFISVGQIDFSDYSYFRPSLDSTHVVILSKTHNGYMIDYETVCKEWILELIGEVKLKGQSYIDDFFKQ